MDAQVAAALTGAAVGSVLTTFSNAYLRGADQNLKARRAYEIFIAFHERWVRIAESGQNEQGRDLPALIQGLEDVTPQILHDGHSLTRKTFLEYCLDFREYVNYAKQGNWGLVDYPARRMRKLGDRALSELADKGIVDPVMLPAKK